MTRNTKWRLILLLTCMDMLAGCAVMDSSEPSELTYVHAEGMPVLGPYSQAVIANGFLFASGVIAVNPKTGRVIEGDIRRQTEQVFNNLKVVLEAGGLTLKDVTRVTVFLKNPQDFNAMNTVYATYFNDHQPARTTVPGVEWGPGILIEVDVIAAVPRT